MLGGGNGQSLLPGRGRACLWERDFTILTTFWTTLQKRQEETVRLGGATAQPAPITYAHPQTPVKCEYQDRIPQMDLRDYRTSMFLFPM